MKKMWYIYTKEYYSAIKRNTFKSVLMRWVNLEHIIQSEVSQKQMNKISNKHETISLHAYTHIHIKLNSSFFGLYFSDIFLCICTFYTVLCTTIK